MYLDQRHLLKFVTSCSRQPLRGFGELNPHFCIQKIPAYTSQYTGLEPPLPGEGKRVGFMSFLMCFFIVFWGYFSHCTGMMYLYSVSLIILAIYYIHYRHHTR